MIDLARLYGPWGSFKSGFLRGTPSNRGFVLLIFVKGGQTAGLAASRYFVT